jgi:hypothetical protein
MNEFAEKPVQVRSCEPSRMYDGSMAFNPHPKGALTFDRTCLRMIVGSFVLLSLAWAIYPSMHASHTSHEDHNLRFALGLRADAHTSAAQTVFLQLRLGSPRIRMIPKILFRLFLCLSVVVLAGAGDLAIATRFWTASGPALDRANKMIGTGPISIFCLKLGVAVGLFNIFLLLFLGRKVKTAMPYCTPQRHPRLRYPP